MHYIQLTRRNGEGVTVNPAAIAFIETNTTASGEVNGTAIYFVGSNQQLMVREKYLDILIKLDQLALRERT